MAKHIAEGRDYPVFFYGQAYFGALEPYLNASLIYLFGFRPNLIYVLPIVFSAVVVLVEYIWVRRVFGGDIAIYSAIIISMSSYVYIEEELFASGGFCLALLLEIIVMWQFVVLYINKSINDRIFLVFCFFSGLLFWVWQIYIPVFIVLMLIWLFNRPNTSIRFVVTGFILFAASSSPLWYYNFLHSGETFIEVFGKFSATDSSSGLASFAGGFIGNRLWNARYYLETLSIGVGGGSYVWLIATGIGVALAIRSVGLTIGRSRITISTIPLVCILAMVVLVVGHRASRYLMVTPLLLTPVMLIGWRNLHRSLGKMVLLLVVATNLWTVWQAVQNPLPPPDWIAIIGELRNNGVHDGYSDFESAYPITFMSGESIIVSPALATPAGYRTDRYPTYTLAVNQASRLFVLVPPGSPDAEKIRSLVTRGHPVTQHQVGPASTYQLYYPLAPQDGLVRWLTNVN